MNAGPTVSLSAITDGLMTARCEFYTWREAVMQAQEIADRFTTVGRPTVGWRYDRWVVRYTYRPMAMNA